MPRPGPKTTLTPERLDKVCEILAEGRSMRDACRIAVSGVSYSAVKREAKRSAHVRNRLKAAQDESEGALTKKLFDVLEKQPQLILSMLERRFPERWSKRNPETVTTTQLSVILAQFAAMFAPLVPPEQHGEMRAKLQSILNDPNLLAKKTTD